MAYKLGERSLQRLKGVHPDLVRVVQRARSAYSGLSTLCMPRSSLSSSAQAWPQPSLRNSSAFDMIYLTGDLWQEQLFPMMSLLRSGSP